MMIKRKRLIISILLALTGILLFYVWLGFFFTNPRMKSWSNWNVEKMIIFWSPRIIIPILYGMILFIVYSRNRKMVQNLSILLITLFICFLIAVPVLYISKTNANSRNIINQFHPYLQLKPPGTDTLNYSYSEGAVRIFCLGGSTTEFVDSRRVGWPEMLEKELRLKYRSDSIFVFNFGRQWYNTLHTLINYETNLRYYKPDVIIVMHNVNDFLQNADFSYLSIGPFRKDYGHFVGPVVDIINTKNTGFLARTRIKFRNMWYYNIPQREIIEQDSFPGLEAYIRNLNTIIDLASMDNTKVILMSQPNIYSENMTEEMYKVSVTINYEGVGKNKMWSNKTGYNGMKQYNQRVMEIAQDRNIYFIDLEKYIPKSLTFFSDEVHYTDTSFSIISKSVVDEIIRLKVLESSIEY